MCTKGWHCGLKKDPPPVNQSLMPIFRNVWRWLQKDLPNVEPF
jgi:hypothetical protein